MRILESGRSRPAFARLGGDGKLEFARKYDVEVGGKTQFWSGMVTLAQKSKGESK